MTLQQPAVIGLPLIQHDPKLPKLIFNSEGAINHNPKKSVFNFHSWCPASLCVYVTMTACVFTNAKIAWCSVQIVDFYGKWIFVCLHACLHQSLSAFAPLGLSLLSSPPSSFSTYRFFEVQPQSPASKVHLSHANMFLLVWGKYQ